MRFWPTGPYDLNRDGQTLLEFDTTSRREWWDWIDDMTGGLSLGCGCYVFAIRSGKTPKPWYVGKAERQSFRDRAISKDKIDSFESVLRTVQRGTPLMYFYARVTAERRNYSVPSRSGYRDIRYLEKMLIGHALQRNPALLNIQETTLLRTMIVPGLLNNGPGALSRDARELRSVLGY